LRSASTFLSSSSATAFIRSNGCAPTSCRQLKKRFGVPLAPICAASCWSAWIRSSPRLASIAAWNFFTSRPSSFA
jgi:hypothetical protein